MGENRAWNQCRGVEIHTGGQFSKSTDIEMLLYQASLIIHVGAVLVGSYGLSYAVSYALNNLQLLLRRDHAG